MKATEFDNTAFGYGDKAVFYGKEYFIASVDFEDRTFELCASLENPERLIYTNHTSVERIITPIEEKK